ncbi:YheC/YheD family protein [Paenibacillus flagellatus]|uniref:ATP-binding protein n=1 Tax=Paenibacillus flagellatus TaxID=2211139 RepID=A0A2V5KM36_9BACL|nr:YheC/YheD family protein [Paenibacillus flagellatus]PYI51957.1 ATP-binding protein [Paenibacillus flagellatus]
MPTTPRTVHSKWRKTAALLRHRTVRAHVPVTKPMNRQTLKDMLDRHRMVYAKPDIGMFGNGVIRIEKRTGPGGAPVYWFQSGAVARTFHTFGAMYDALGRYKKRRSYLVQKGIHLLKHGGRRFDLRVMVQQSPKRRWETTGLIGRLAHPRKVVTNYHNGGTPMPVGTLLATHMPKARREAVCRRLEKLGVDTAAQMARSFPGVKEIGLDVALDRTLHPWILEVNTLPDPYIFRTLKDKTMFRKIYRYAVAYGRIRTRARSRKR